MTSVPNLRLRSNGNKRVFIALLLIFGLTSSSVHAQLELGMQLYELAEYSDALRKFKESDGPTARLYEARTYYQLGEYEAALSGLKALSIEPSTPLGAEIRYSKGVVHLAMGNTAAALSELFTIRTIHAEANRLFTEVITYMSPRERDEVAAMVTQDMLKREILNYQRTANRFPPAPRGTIIPIGVLLPVSDRNSPTYSVVQGLYQGILLAVDEFNERSPNLKLSLHFANNANGLTDAFHELRTKHNVRAIIGPLRSEEVEQLASLAESMKIPLLVPLANSYTLRSSGSYVFRFNPTIEDTGVEMANAAFNVLKLRRVAVLTTPNAETNIYATAFIRTFESLGGKIVLHLADARFTDLRYTSRRLDTLIVKRPNQPDSLIADAVYIPASGDDANSVVDNILSSIDSKRLPLTILGNEELGYLDHSAARLERIPTYHTSSVDVSPKGDRLEQFRNRYIGRTSIDPNDFAYVGYDLATYMLETLSLVQHSDYLADQLPRMPLFRGLSTQVQFNGRGVNRRVPVYKITPDGPAELISGQ